MWVIKAGDKHRLSTFCAGRGLRQGGGRVDPANRGVGPTDCCGQRKRDTLERKRERDTKQCEFLSIAIFDPIRGGRYIK